MASAPGNRSRGTAKTVQLATETGDHEHPNPTPDFECPATRPRRHDADQPSAKRGHQLDEEDLVEIISKLFCAGNRPREIRDILESQYGLAMSHYQIYPKLQKACLKGSISYTPKADHQLRDRLRERYPMLDQIAVSVGPTTEGVTYRAAQELSRVIREVHAQKKLRLAKSYDGGVHMGLSGGYTLRLLSQYFAKHLVEKSIHGDDIETRTYGDFPPLLYLHAMVAGFDTYDPTIEPNAMFTHLHLGNQIPTQMRFVGFNAPPVVRQEQIEEVKQLPHIKTAYDEAGKIDIAVTSMGAWSDPDCMLRKCMAQFPNDFDRLEKSRVIGDMMWRPFSQDGPINGVTDMRAMTVMDLHELSRLIWRGGKVMLVVGPTRRQQSKAVIIRRLLDFRRPLVTHLVVDSNTGKKLLN